MNDEVELDPSDFALCHALFSEKWDASWLHPDFLIMSDLISKNQTATQLLEAGLLTVVHPGIYSFPVLKKEVCEMILDESENFIRYATERDIPIHRPNSMNNYGVILNFMGMRDILTDLQLKYFLPVSKAFFPIEASAFTSHHSFIVSYQPDKDRALDLHTDDSDLTWNICLGREGFTGSGLTFCGVMAEANHRQYSCSYQHKVGHAVVHLGSQRHGAESITSGERHNLIMWCKNDVYRSSELFEERMHSYQKESGPPDLRCLSYTHDRDYIVFKGEYPKGNNPYDSVGTDSSDSEEGEGGGREHKKKRRPHTMPWCPPPQFGYDGLWTKNKIMLTVYDNLVTQEEERKKKKNPHKNATKPSGAVTGDGNGGEEEKGDIAVAGSLETLNGDSERGRTTRDCDERGGEKKMRYGEEGESFS